MKRIKMTNAIRMILGFVNSGMHNGSTWELSCTNHCLLEGIIVHKTMDLISVTHCARMWIVDHERSKRDKDFINQALLKSVLLKLHENSTISKLKRVHV